MVKYRNSKHKDMFKIGGVYEIVVSRGVLDVDNPVAYINRKVKVHINPRPYDFDYMHAFCGIMGDSEVRVKITSINPDSGRYFVYQSFLDESFYKGKKKGANVFKIDGREIDVGNFFNIHHLIQTIYPKNGKPAKDTLERIEFLFRDHMFNR